MPTKSNKQKGGRGARKYGRANRKAISKANPISLFVRGRITAAEYFRLTGQEKS